MNLGPGSAPCCPLLCPGLTSALTMLYVLCLAVRQRPSDGGGASAAARRQLLSVSVEHGQPGLAAAHIHRTLGRGARVRLAPARADAGAR